MERELMADSNRKNDALDEAVTRIKGAILRAQAEASRSEML